MAETTAISWADYTFNPWIGCTEVSPACDNCYARTWGGRFGVDWGPGAARRRTVPAYWKKPAAWNKKADAFRAKHGHWPRVFAASLADIFDNEVDPAWRKDFFDVVRATPKLTWLIVTKRIGNVRKMLPPDWGTGWANVVLIITVANQAEADRDINKLVATPAWKRGLSVEPILGPINLSRWLAVEKLTLGGRPHWTERTGAVPAIDWVIGGGESLQPKLKRPLVDLEAQWVRDLRDQCVAASVAFHFKQWGHTVPSDQVPAANDNDLADVVMVRTTTGLRLVHQEWMGRLIDGEEWNQFPEVA